MHWICFVFRFLLHFFYHYQFGVFWVLYLICFVVWYVLFWYVSLRYVWFYMFCIDMFLWDMFDLICFVLICFLGICLIWYVLYWYVSLRYFWFDRFCIDMFLWDMFLRYAFLRQLPSDVRSHLVHDNTVDITVLSQRADEIYRSSLSPRSSVNAVDLVLAVNTLSSRQNPRPQCSQRPSSPVTRHSQTPAAPYRHSTSPSSCWYHAKFGAKALSCQSPCSWSGN